MANALIVHGGAPTAVMNASLYGVIREAKKSQHIDKLYAAIGGSGSIVKERFLDLLTVPEAQAALLPLTPASAIGTSRDALEAEDYHQIAETLRKNDIRCIFFNGGNGTMDACGKVYQACRDIGYEVQVVGIPKTIDNDIAVTDHAPGFASAARYVAQTVSEISQDVRALPIHVSVVETMGRNAGWLTAAAALARSGDGDGPDLIYLPECSFDEDKFLTDVDRLVREKRGVVVAASEGLHYTGGIPIVEPIFQVGRSTYYGDVGAHLANLVIRRLGVKARSEKPGIIGRCSISQQSRVDREEAELVGAEAVRAALSGENGVMVGIFRDSTDPYAIHTGLIPIEKVMLDERKLPRSFINADENDVTQDFIDWCRPLLGGDLRKFVTFQNMI